MRASAWALAAGLVGAAAALSAQQTPESILPPGFGEPPQATPTPAPRPTASATPGGASVATVQPLPSGVAPLPTPSPTPTPTATIDPETLAEYELPASARRSLASVGPIGPEDGGLDAGAFGGADGRYLESLMRSAGGPLASRWLEIGLRRALVSEVTTPAHVNGADFAAERAWLLLRMGEAQAARAVVQSVDRTNYTPKLYQVAMQAEFASGDPAGLCPLVDGALQHSSEPAWVLAKPICVSLAGTPAAAQPLMQAARRRHVAGGVDLLLARKLVGAGGQGRQAVTIEWDGVDRLTTWRYGLATATGVDIPDTLYAGAGPQVTGWRATAPAIPLAGRVAAAEAAAATGVLSNAALVDLYSAVYDDQGDDDANAAASAVAADLRSAYADAGADTRRSALRKLWGDGARTPYGRLVLTARAAAQVAPANDDADADRLVASMLTAGLDRTAGRWRDHVSEGSDAWAMLLLADPDAAGLQPYRTLGRYSGKGDAALKQRLFFAGLAGLGRLSPDDVERAARALDVRIGAENSWTRAIDRAAADGEAGTVILLASLPLHTPVWRGVPPEALYRIIGALRAVDQGALARMIAAEAIARA